ncbi:hypothetical protein [Novosphingobium sp.]|uniref:hypothetical protein n=1 Tax=Novosphingobium sp. TaxID=1874826 RepID=UPI003B52A2A8
MSNRDGSRTDRHFAIALLVVIAAGCAQPAHAGVLSLAMPATLASPDGMDDPSVMMPDLADLDLAALSAQAGFAQAFDAALISNILQSTGLATRLAGGPVKPPVSGVRDAFMAKLPRTMQLDPGLAAIANPTFGAHEGVAVSVSDQFVATDKQSAGINTEIRIIHKTGAVDAAFNLTGRQNFNVPDPMAVSYDGHALVSVGSMVQLGVDAHGTLGTVSALTTANMQTAGPRLRLNMGDGKMSISSDLGYDYGFNPATPANRSQVHVSMGLKLKL